MGTQTFVDNTVNDLRYEIIMRIHITTIKYTVNKIWKMKNEEKYADIYKTESIQKHYLNYYVRKLRLGKR